VVALLYVALILGLLGSGVVLGLLLQDFSPLRLVQVVQGTALVTVALNAVALWKQEARQPRRSEAERPAFRSAWASFAGRAPVRRLLWAVGLGTAAFSMQDILLEPYGGQVLHLPVARTSLLSALTALGALLAFGLAARALQQGRDAVRLAAGGALLGVWAFAAVVFAEPLESVALYAAGAGLIGLGGGLFSVAMLSAVMSLDEAGDSGVPHGLALGAWGAVQASAAGLAIALGGALRDAVSAMAVAGWLGPALSSPGVGFSVVYHLEIALLFATLVALGPLVRRARPGSGGAVRRFGLAEFPG
jgi:MFS transporter, BCD family, chlorophyll transporter